MPEVVEDYDPEDGEHRGYNVEAVREALKRFGPPPNSHLPPMFSAFDVFAGYLVFDALIAHVDRHDRNWAVLVPPPGSTATEALCASFDHAASLGLLLTEEARAKHANQGTVADWALGGRANKFEHSRGTRPQSLVDLAASAVTLCPPHTGTHWRDQIMSVDADSIDDLVGSAPGLSIATRRFIAELVMINRERFDTILGENKLPERVGAALFDALIGLRVTRPSYLKQADVDERTATRDLVRAAEIGLLEARGERRGRHYLAGRALTTIQEELRRQRAPLTDPYPTLTDEIRRAR
jgi:hypothetical protein